MVALLLFSLVCVMGYEDQVKANPMNELEALRMVLKGLVRCEAEGHPWTEVFASADENNDGCITWDESIIFYKETDKNHVCLKQTEKSSFEPVDKTNLDVWWTCVEDEIIRDEENGMTLHQIFEKKLDTDEKDGCVTMKEHEAWVKAVNHDCLLYAIVIDNKHFHRSESFVM